MDFHVRESEMRTSEFYDTCTLCLCEWEGCCGIVCVSKSSLSLSCLEIHSHTHTSWIIGIFSSREGKFSSHIFFSRSHTSKVRRGRRALHFQFDICTQTFLKCAPFNPFLLSFYFIYSEVRQLWGRKLAIKDVKKRRQCAGNFFWSPRKKKKKEKTCLCRRKKLNLN